MFNVSALLLDDAFLKSKVPVFWTTLYMPLSQSSTGHFEGERVGPPFQLSVLKNARGSALRALWCDL